MRDTRAVRIGVAGPVGCGKTSLIERMLQILIGKGVQVGVITNDIYTCVDEAILRGTGLLPPELIVGVEVGGCPHTAIRDDTSLNLDAAAQLEASRDLELIFIESGGDNLTAVFSSDLADTWLFILDAGGGHKVAGKGGPGIASAPILVINKADIAERTGTDLELMVGMAASVRDGSPVVITSARTNQGIGELVNLLEDAAAAVSPVG